MNVYIGRQPIFDRKNAIFGYELLFRQNNANYFTAMDDDIATAEVIYNSFLVFGIDNITDGSIAFINFSKNLVASDFIGMLPKNQIVVEILERESATQATLDACIKFRDMGYTLAVDDFVLDEDNLPLLDLIDIVKVEFPSVSINDQASLITKYKHKVKFLAEKIESREEYASAVKLGYDFFQGYFFSKPSVLNSKDIGLINANLIRIIEELNQSEPNYKKIAAIIEMDLSLSYKLLRLVNSAYISPRYGITSIRQALNFLGTREMYQWISLMMIKDMQTAENSELVKQSLIRGKLMSLLCVETKQHAAIFEYFFTGIFSLMDILLNQSIADLLKGLPLTNNVKQALLGESNDLREVLDYVIGFEKNNWDELNRQPLCMEISADRFMNLYVDSLKWAKNIGSF
jgi:EAL and modified HD-GYP domain-containing signal transduction protein